MGRGRSKVSATASAGPLSARIKRAKTLDEAIKLAEKNQIYTTKDVVDRVQNKDHIKDALSEMAWAKEEFPGMLNDRDYDLWLDATDREPNGYMLTYTTEPTIAFAGYYMSSQETVNMESSWAYSVEEKFHPAGTSFVHASTHEMGHQLVRSMAAEATKYYFNDSGYSGYTRVNEYFAKKIVQASAKRMKSSMKLRGATNAFRRDISDYATSSYNETVAEALADYRANGTKAKPLSQHIFKTLKAVEKEGNARKYVNADEVFNEIRKAERR